MIKSGKFHPFSVPARYTPLWLLFLCGLSYGLLIPKLGLYSDDWLFTWMSYSLGPAGLTRFFALSRPLWGQIYQVTLPLIGPFPWRWNLFALLGYWLAALAFWGLVRLLWPEKAAPAAWAAAVYAVYPGFLNHFLAISSAHFFIVLTAYTASLVFTLLALRKPGYFWVFTLLALLASAVNLLTMEYFFGLELLRPVLIWIVIGEKEKLPSLRLKRTFLYSQPYLLLFVATAIWRSFFFKMQTYHWKLLFWQQFQADPLGALLSLPGSVLRDLWAAAGLAWGNALQFPTLSLLRNQPLPLWLYWLVVLLAGLGSFIFLAAMKQGAKIGFRGRAHWSLQVGIVGVLAMLLGGTPFYLTDIQVQVSGIYSRFTIPYVLGVSLCVAALVYLLPQNRWLNAGLLALLVGFSAGGQFLEANRYRQDWDMQERLFWQMAWRMPGLQPGTVLVSNEFSNVSESSSFVNSALNLIYAPGNSTAVMPYGFLFASEAGLDPNSPDWPGAPLSRDLEVAKYTGTGADVVTVYFDGRCLQVLDPTLSPFNPSLDLTTRDLARLSHPGRIETAPAGGGATLPESIFGPQPAHDWCYYFEKADLATQMGDWQQVAQIGDAQLQTGKLKYNTLSDYLPFIQGYAHVNRWDRAEQLSGEILGVNPYSSTLICNLWNELAGETPATPEKAAALGAMRAQVGCIQ